MVYDTDFASYVNNNTLYVSANTIDEVIKRLRTASANLFKCHLIVSKIKGVSMHIVLFEIKNTNCQNLLEIKVDCRFNFHEHLDGIMMKTSRKIMHYLG